MRVSDPKETEKYEYFRNKYLSGHKKTNIKESSVSDDIDLVRFAHREAKEVKKRERDKQPKEAPDSYAARFFGNKPKSNKKVVNEISDDLIRRAADSAYDKAVKSKRKGFTTAEKIYNQQGERFDDALEKRRMQDNEKAEMNSLSPAKRRKFFNLKEDAKQDRVSNMMWRDARTAQKAHKQDGEYRAKIALRNKIGSSKYRKNMELSDDNFSISDQQGQIADKHLDGARRDHNRRLEKAVANAKAKGYMQKENIDEGKITKMLPGAIRNLIVKLKAGRHYGKAREKAGEEYSAAVKSKDIMKSYPAAMKMGRLGRKARNPGKEVIEKGKNFFRGEQQNEELMLPSGLVMTSTGEAINQSVVKQRRGQV